MNISISNDLCLCYLIHSTGHITHTNSGFSFFILLADVKRRKFQTEHIQYDHVITISILTGPVTRGYHWSLYFSLTAFLMMGTVLSINEQ